ncbi:MAG: sporulation integral membrane protein YtvI [Oscillospiraceae bacterium]|nr:sporulation integral membrane protein YtvI [Oscillospiraceae bacterium]
MFEERCKKFLLYLFSAAAAAGLFYLVFRYLFWWLLPFLLALGVAAAVEPVVAYLRVHLRFRRSFSALLLTLVLLFLLGGLLSLLGTTLANQAYALLKKAPLLLERVPQLLDAFFARLDGYSAAFPQWLRDSLYGAVMQALSDAESFFSDLTGRFLSFLGSFAAALPRRVLSGATTVLAVYFTIASYPTLCRMLKARLSGKTIRSLRLFRSGVTQSLSRYLRAELTISFLNFLQLLLGFFLMRQDYALLLAFLITLLDALPVFGTGTALVPWALLSLLFSSVPKAIALLALYLCTLLVRNVLEPKLLASQAGLPPVASLFAMYLGFCTFGVAGMIAFPFLLLLAAQTYRLGTQET